MPRRTLVLEQALACPGCEAGTLYLERASLVPAMRYRTPACLAAQEPPTMHLRCS